MSADRQASARLRRSGTFWGIVAILSGLWAAFWTLAAFVNFVALPFGLIGLLTSWEALRQAKLLHRRWIRWSGWAGLALSAYAVVFGALVVIDGLTGKARF